ncbi:rhamnan synthesis F family protein [Dyella sp.]|uniref:rhamnan synthesis F family protein n=1 Tax=Dyella sp. TaxID=1869338 RepID=UPI002ED4676D
MKRVLFYLFFDEQGVVDDYIPYKLSKLREHVDTIFVVSNSPLDEEARRRLEGVADIVHVRENVGFDVWGYKEAMETFGEKRLEEYDELILMNYTFFGPIYPFSETFAAMDAKDCDFWGITAHKAMTPNPFTREGTLPLHLNSHWISVRRSMFMSKEFRNYWAKMPPITSYVDSILQHESKFTDYFSKKGFRYEVTFPVEDYPTEYSAFQSIEMMLRNRCPIFKRRLFFHDPLFLEQNAIILRDAMEMVEREGNYDPDLIWKNIVRTAHPRTIHTNLDLLEILPETALDAHATTLPRIAVLAHLYYDDMVDEIMEYVSNIPYPIDLYVTTHTEEKKTNIEAALTAYALNKVDVRVMEQNRGRDMGSLFISLRDVLLSGRYDYACRIHSKKSPQNGYNMAMLFKQHMFDNLLYTPGYVQNVIELFQKNPTLGMVMPPVVQIAYPTLGHAWFANREPAAAWAKKLGIETAFDDATPMAPYGTMFWFRPEALRKLAGHQFEWSDFGPEPNHVDGSLAHVLERLMGYAAMSDGYHLRCVMNRRWAAINYTKLEYKLQRLASQLPNGNIFDQIFWIERAKAVISNLARVSQKDPWSDAAGWLEQAKDLHQSFTLEASGGVKLAFRALMTALRRSFVYRFPRVAGVLRPMYRKVVKRQVR